MVEVTFVKGDYGFETLRVVGHAEYNPGNDIVCSAISALTQALVGTLQNIKGLEFNKKIIQDGNVTVELAPFVDEEMQRIVDTIFLTVLIGLKQIEKSYPQNIHIVH